MTDNELLLAISSLIDDKLKPLHERLDSVESQINHSERVLKNEIRNSENLILSEVERVHNILTKHTDDKTKHTA